MQDDERQNTALPTRGLIGGSPSMRAHRRRVLPVEHPLFLSPLDDDDHARQLVEFMSSSQPVAVEIGFGKGLFLVSFAAAHPDWRFIGLEVKSQLCRIALSRLDKQSLANARVILADARYLLPRFVPGATIDALFILFPDPWWKKRHHKRRILDTVTLAPLLPLLKDGALLTVRSDVPAVLDLASEVIAELGCFQVITDPGMELPRTDRERRYDGTGVPHEQMCFRYQCRGSL
jgi:tRNA (guanine-N7-)-methyltransferase